MGDGSGAADGARAATPTAARSFAYTRVQRLLGTGWAEERLNLAQRHLCPHSHNVSLCSAAWERPPAPQLHPTPVHQGSVGRPCPPWGITSPCSIHSQAGAVTMGAVLGDLQPAPLPAPSPHRNALSRALLSSSPEPQNCAASLPSLPAHPPHCPAAQEEKALQVWVRGWRKLLLSTAVKWEEEIEQCASHKHPCHHLPPSERLGLSGKEGKHLQGQRD